ncbi:MAG: DUF535 family protein [Caldimonas sp.]
MLRTIDTLIRGWGNSAKRAAILVLAVAVLVLDLSAGPIFPFGILYYTLIILSVSYVEGPFSYVIAVITALARSYGLYDENRANETLLSGIWQLASTLTLHAAICYLYTFYYNAIQFLRPTNNPLLEKEHSECRLLKRHLFRPYVHSRWTMAKRLKMIANHYRLVERNVPFLNLAHDKMIELARLDAGGMALRITIDRPGWMRQEGEISVSIWCGIDRIYASMILLSSEEDEIKLIVGSLQGDGRDRVDLYKQLTKAMHGMRPRDLLVNAIKMIGHELGCKELLGISDAFHRSTHWLTKASKISAYDDIWRENGATTGHKSGFLTIPVQTRRRSVEEIPSNKRALYRRRYQFLDDLQARIKEGILSTTSRLSERPSRTSGLGSASSMFAASGQGL